MIDNDNGKFLMYDVQFQMEEGSEAEVLPTPSTRARGRGNRGRRFGVRGSIPRYTGLNEGRCTYSQLGMR